MFSVSRGTRVSGGLIVGKASIFGNLVADDRRSFQRVGLAGPMQSGRVERFEAAATHTTRVRFNLIRHRLIGEDEGLSGIVGLRGMNCPISQVECRNLQPMTGAIA